MPISEINSKHPHPGYIGYQVIDHGDLQNGKHCCDIAMHADNITNNPSAALALKFLEQPLPRKNPFFNNILDEGNSIMAAQQILNKLLQEKRRELCDFAVDKIKNSQENIIYRMLLAPEIQTALLESRDFSIADLRSDNLKVEFLSAIEEFNNDNTAKLINFCQNTDVCIDYIEKYYRAGNNLWDDAGSARMFIVPSPYSTGMLNIAAMHLKKKIIVISSRNGAPFSTQDYSNGTKPPVYIGYDGTLHFVQLQPYTIDELVKICTTFGNPAVEQSIYEGILAVAIMQQAGDVVPQQLVVAQQFLVDLKAKYAEIITALKSIEENQKKFTDIIDNAHPEFKQASELYGLLLQQQTNWLSVTILSQDEASRAQQIQSQKELLGDLLDKILELNVDIKKALVDIIWIVSATDISVETKITAIHEMKQQLQDLFVAHAYQAHRPISQTPAISMFQNFQLFISAGFTYIANKAQALFNYLLSIPPANSHEPAMLSESEEEKMPPNNVFVPLYKRRNVNLKLETDLPVTPESKSKAKSRCSIC